MSNSGCAQVETLLAEYALGKSATGVTPDLTPEKTLLVARHLKGCPDCRVALEEMSEVITVISTFANRKAPEVSKESVARVKAGVFAKIAALEKESAANPTPDVNGIMLCAVSKYEKTLLERAVRITRDYQLAEDAVQEAFEKLFAHLQEDGDRSNLQAWLITAMRNAAINRHYKHSRELPCPLDDEDCPSLSVPARASFSSKPVGAEVKSDELAQQLRASLKNLPPRQREAITLQYFDELSTKETADRMGCTEKSVYTHTRIAMKKLKQDPIMRSLFPDR